MSKRNIIELIAGIGDEIAGFGFEYANGPATTLQRIFILLRIDVGIPLIGSQEIPTIRGQCDTVRLPQCHD